MYAISVFILECWQLMLVNAWYCNNIMASSLPSEVRGYNRTMISVDL